VPETSTPDPDGEQEVVSDADDDHDDGNLPDKPKAANDHPGTDDQS